MLDVTVALLMSLICIIVHFEALTVIERLVDAIKSPRLSLLTAWTGLLAAHVCEIWLYAAAYAACAHFGVGTLSGVENFLDYVYYSGVVYTTLGFGDIVPSAGVQILTGSEALVGLSLIAWSATVTYARVLLHQNNRRRV